jgi:hypothetical protein
VRPRYRGLYPGLPDSVPVLDRNPAAPLQDALPGSVWIGGHGRLLHVSVAHLQFETGVTHEPGSESPRPLEPAWRFWTRELLSILAFLMRRSSYRGSSESARAQ